LTTAIVRATITFKGPGKSRNAAITVSPVPNIRARKMEM
jgi:hypothetical protein